MRVIHLARKPLSESTVAANTLRHGTGALNINGTRVTANDVDDVQPFGGMPLGNTDAGDAGFRRPWMADRQAVLDKQLAAIDRLKRLGRWPANVLFQHTAACRQVGVASIRSDGHYPASRGRGSQVSGPSGHAGQQHLREQHTDGEQVPVWNCGPGCPVADLDAQSGDRPVSGAAKTGRPATGGAGTGVVQFGVEQGNGTLHNDSGGASRFFKQLTRSRE